MKQLIVAGIGTGVGKTVASAVLVEALEADYWKPVQSGSQEDSDTLTVQHLISNQRSFFHEEAYQLKAPLSPHIAAEMEGREIQPEQLSLPAANNHLIVELAGGLMTPLNDRTLNIDLVKKWDKPVVLVSQNYLGSINHTLLSAEALKQQHITIAGIIFNGEETASSESLILNYTQLPFIGRIPMLPALNARAVSEVALYFKSVLKFI
jgi:dethiobiotin synthetase